MLLGDTDSLDGGIETHAHVGRGLRVLGALRLTATLLRFG